MSSSKYHEKQVENYRNNNTKINNLIEYITNGIILLDREEKLLINYFPETTFQKSIIYLKTIIFFKFSNKLLENKEYGFWNLLEQNDFDVNKYKLKL